MYLFLHKDIIHLVKEVSRGDEGDDGGALKETRAGAKNKGQREGKAGGINKREMKKILRNY